MVLSRSFGPPKSPPKSRRRRSAHDHRRQHPDRPPPARRRAGPARRRPGRRPTPWRPSSPTIPSAFTPPSRVSSTNGAATEAYAPCWRNLSPWPATWPPAPTPAPTPAPASPHAARHQRHYQGARVGEAGIAVSGPRCACRFKGMGRRLSKPQRQAAALTTASPASAVAASKRPSRLRNGAGSTWPWLSCCPTPD